MSDRGSLLFVLSVYVLWLVFGYQPHFVDWVNVIIHEAGHVFLAPFGLTLQAFGGTLAQLLLPALCVGYFLHHGAVLEASLVGIWFWENLMYVALYVSDAQARALPMLFEGGIHDWHWLLSRWGGLQHCEAIGSVLHGIASLGALTCLGLVAAQLYARREAAATRDD